MKHNESNEAADEMELDELIEGLANAQAAANDGLVDMLELRRSVLLTLGVRFQPQMDSMLEDRVLVYGLHAMKMHYLDARYAEVKAEIRRKRQNNR